MTAPKSIKAAIAALGYTGKIKRGRGRPRNSTMAPANTRRAAREVAVVAEILKEQTGRVRGTRAEAIKIVAEWHDLDEQTLHNLINRPKADRRR